MGNFIDCCLDNNDEKEKIIIDILKTEPEEKPLKIKSNNNSEEFEIVIIN
jgi:hypothetical protein